MSRTVLVTVIICSFLLAIGVWYYLQTQEEPLPLPPPPQHIIKETAQIERQIEQVKADRDPPEVLKLNDLVTAFESDPTRWDIVIAVGDIYRKGAYPRFLPNEELALRCYKIASMCPDGRIAGMGQSKYIETYDDPIKEEDKKGDNLPVGAGMMICDLAEDTIKSTPWHMFEKPKAFKQEQHREPVAVAAFDYDFMDDLAWMTARTTDVVPEMPIFRHDSQNVHDHGVTKVTAFNLEKIKENININFLNTSKELEEVKHAILETKDLDTKTKDDALHVIDKLNDSRHSSFDTTEKESLAMVWEKIKSKDPAMRENLTETLGKQLASAIENGHVVCSSGKITRIVSALDGTGETEAARPMWALREELASKAAKIRDDVTEKYGDTPEAGKRMREEFASVVKNEYVKKLGMSERIIAPMIEEYSMGF